MSPTEADHAEEVRDDVLRAVRQAFAAGGDIEPPTVSALARVVPHEPEEIETALRVLQDVGDIRLTRSGSGALGVGWVRMPS